MIVAQAELRTQWVWREAGLEDLPAVAEDAPYRDLRLRLRFQAAVFQGWTAWQLHEFPGAIRAFHAALDHAVCDPDLVRWLVTHLTERRGDYLQKPINGAWLARSACPDAAQAGVLVEHLLPERTLAKLDKPAHAWPKYGPPERTQPAIGNVEYGHPTAPIETHPQLQYGKYEHPSAERTSDRAYDEPTVDALDLLHRLLLAEPDEFRRMAPLYYAYHPFVEPATRMVLAPIVAGSFTMGSPETESERLTDEGPQHRVTLSHDFWMGIHPVTQEQYQIVMGKNPSAFRGKKLPVESVFWNDAVAFCERLTKQASVTGQLPEGYTFRLPTEAEWEYCCRAGTETATAFGDQLGSEQANFNGKLPYNGAEKGPYLEQTSDVGSYPANPWGLYDMHGNVWEWCLDAADFPGEIVDTDTYREGQVDPLCKRGGSRVHRGGSWDDCGGYCRSACRGADLMTCRSNNLGFRVCLARGPVGASQAGDVTEIGSHVPPVRSRAGTSSRSQSRRARKKDS